MSRNPTGTPGERIEALLDALRAELKPEPFAQVTELLREVLTLHGEGLARMGEVLREQGESAAPLRARLLEEPAFAALLLLHDLHPESLEARVERGLERVRPQLAQHEGGATLLSVDADSGAVRLRLEGTCDGCPASQLTLRQLIETAIRDEAPEIRHIEVEEPRSPLRDAPPSEPLLQLTESGPARSPETLVARTRSLPEPGDEERCGLCGNRVEPRHVHLVDLEHRRLVCACTPCRLLLERDGSGGKRFKALPERRRRIDRLDAAPDLWERLGIPVRLAFFFANSELSRPVGFYPSPAGPTESAISLEAWGELVDANPALAGLEPDVEAALLHEPEPGRTECFLVPIDVCYALTGLVRRSWRGFGGGVEVWNEIHGFFDGLREGCDDVGAEAS